MDKTRAIEWLDKIIYFSLCSLIFALPFSKSLIEIFFVLALVCWIVKKLIKVYSGNRHFTPQGLLKTTVYYLTSEVETISPRNALKLPIAIFIFFGFISMLASVSLSLSLEGFFLKLLEGIVLYYIIVETIHSKSLLNKTLFAILCSIILISIDVAFQIIIGQKGVDFLRGYKYYGDYMLQGTFASSNGFGSWLMVMSMLVLSIVYFGKDEWFNAVKKYNWLKWTIRLGLWGIFALLVYFLILTSSAGAWMGMILSVIFIGIFRSRKILIEVSMVLIILCLTIPVSMRNINLSSTITFMRSIVPVSISSLIPASIKSKIIPTIYTGIDSGSFRIDSWKEAISIIRDFPAFGCGLNTYTVVAPYYKISEGTGIYPHNSYLQMAAESGLLGLGAFLSIIVTLFLTSLANLRKIKDEYYKTILVAFLAALFGFLAHAFIDVHFYSLQLATLMWFMIGLIVAIQRIALKEQVQVPPGVHIQ